MALRQILTTLAGVRAGIDALGNFVLNRRDGSQIILDADASTGVPSIYTRTAAGVEAQYPVSGAGTADLVVFGANPGGLFAAIAAKKRGAKVTVLEPSNWIGGMLTGGLSATDVLYQDWSAYVVGAVNDFFVDVGKEVGMRQEAFFRAGYAANPSIFQRVLNRWLAAAGVTVTKNAQLLSVAKTGTRITSITTTAGTFSGTTFIDGTYEGDLVAMAGCTTAIGREANSTYTETYNGVRALLSDATQLVNVDPYITAGVAGSGYLPGIKEWSSEVLGSTGDASPWVMAYTYRLCTTKGGASKIAMPEPSNYDPLRYELLGRHITNTSPAWTTLDAQALVVPLQGGGAKYDWNSGSYPMGTNYSHPECTEWVTASYARRAVIAENIKQHVLGWFKFMRTDSRVPSAVRTDAAGWGLCGDEFEAYGGFSPQVYVREGRRLVGDFVMTDTMLLNAQTFTDGVVIPYYGLDSHIVRRVITGGVVKNEGNVLQAILQGNVTIPYRVMRPKAAECTNLLATFAVSASHTAYCSLRMEPVSMALGEAAGVAAVIAAQRGIDVAAVSATEIQAITDRYRFNVPGGAIMSADGTTLTGGTVTTNGTWNSGAAGIAIGFPPHFVSSATGAYKRFAPNLQATSAYDVYVHYLCKSSSTRSAVAPVSIVHAAGTTNITLNQNASGEGGNWVNIGRYTFKAGTPSANYVEFDTDGVGGGTVVTAVKFVPAT